MDKKCEVKVPNARLFALRMCRDTCATAGMMHEIIQQRGVYANTGAKQIGYWKLLSSVDTCGVKTEAGVTHNCCMPKG